MTYETLIKLIGLGVVINVLFSISYINYQINYLKELVKK